MKKFAWLFALTMLVTAALAQTTPAPPSQKRTPPTPAEMAQRRVDHLTKRLSLTAAQQAQALTIFTSAAASAATLHDNAKAAHDALQTAITSNNTAAIDQNTATIGNLAAQAANIRAKAAAAFYQILTPDQQTQFGQVMDRGRGGFGERVGRHGHGGMGFRHAPPPGAPQQ